MVERALARTPTKAFYVNAHVFNLAHDDTAFRAALCGADIVLADGYGAVLAARWLADRRPTRVAITDYIWDFCRMCAERGARVFIVAGRPGVAEKARLQLEARTPGLEIVGTHHGYLTDPGASDEVVAAIQQSKADVVCVGMGSPRQELWIDANASELGAPLVFAVGAVMDFVSGEVDRARPNWMSRWGLEWTSRLAAEPRRMWRRYVIGHPRFLLRLARARMRQGRA